MLRRDVSEVTVLLNEGREAYICKKLLQVLIYRQAVLNLCSKNDEKRKKSLSDCEKRKKKVRIAGIIYIDICKY